MLKHGYTGADFRACREYCGWPQEAAATSIGISTHAIKMWETPKSTWEPRDNAWPWIDNELKHHESEVSRILDVVEDLKTLTPELSEVTLVLFRTNDGLGSMRGDGRPANVHNAIMRDAWQYLAEDGITAKFIWAAQYQQEPDKYPDAIW